MESSEPFPSSRRDDNPYREGRKVAETELSDARKTVRDLALKIEKANSRTKGMQQTTPKWREQEASSKNEEDFRYAQAMEEIEHIKHELSKLKLEMKHVLKQKRQADNSFKITSSKNSTLSSAVERIKKEIEDLDEEHVLVEIARIEAVKEREAIEAQINEEADHYKTQLEDVKKKVEDITQQNELQITLYNGKETKTAPDLLNTITEELESAKTELADIKREGFNFMASMDVIRNELNNVREERRRLEKQEEKRDLTVESLNAKILKAKAKLEAVTSTTEKANTIASNLSLTVEQLSAEAETAKKEKDLIIKELENMKMEIPKTESEIELCEKQLEAAMEELKSVKSSELSTLENLKNLIDSTVRARELSCLNKSTITITKFEFDYLTGTAEGAEVIGEKKVAAAQAWVEALKANEKEILMKVEMGKKEIRKLSVGVEEEVEPGDRRRSVDGKVVASPRRSMYKIGSMTPVKRGRAQKLLSPATRHAIRSASFTKKREKVTRSLSKLLDENSEMGD